MSIKSIIKNTFIYRLILKARNTKAAKECLIKRYGKDIQNINQLASDMISMREKYEFSFSEYIFFGFKDLPMEKRLEFVSDKERRRIAEKMNSSEKQEIFDNKAKTYEYFGKYYKRDVCSVSGDGDLEAFCDFVKDKRSFIVKPADSFCGKGIEIVSVSDKPEVLFGSLLESRKDGFVAEELVCQCEFMAQFHPKSCNTVRVPTVRFDGGVEVINPFFRVGRGDSVVDNAGSGGIIVAIDAKTGVTFAACDEMGYEYVNHPDTEVNLIGVQIPRWDELIALAKEVALVIPENRYAGWDFALTDAGWVMIEGNARGQFVWQIASKIGFKKELSEILHRLGLENN